MDNKEYIQLKNDDILRLWIRDNNGKETGECLEFDLEDIELPLKMQDMLEKEEKNRAYIKGEVLRIQKQTDKKGKKLFSANQEQEIKAVNNFFKKEIEIYNMFLGENGVQKLLNGRKFGWTTLKEIDTLIEKQIAPKLNVTQDNITKKIKEKYGIHKSDVIE